MQVLYVSAEVYPLAKTGGLGDVAAALPAAMRSLGVDVRVLMPAYACVRAQAPTVKRVTDLGDPFGWGNVRLIESRHPDSHVPLFLLDCPRLYDRPGGPYQDAGGKDWPDNHIRFSLLNQVAAALCDEDANSWQPDILHLNDWHCGLAAALLSERTGTKTATVFTVHNLAYQGIFPKSASYGLRLPNECQAKFDFYGNLSFLKAGLSSADVVTTVSPTYASEIQTSDYGCGLDGLIRGRSSRLFGILNGADYGLWDPCDDPHLPYKYSAKSVSMKAVDKRYLQAELGLEVCPGKPLLAFMSRLAHQKMPDLVLQALPALLEEGFQFAIVAQGEKQYEEKFRDLASGNSGRMSATINYSEPLAHRLLAGADILLHPSRFEPCGLVPIYALRYGTIPLVRRCGGMIDTIVDFTESSIRAGSATGLFFEGEGVSNLLERARAAKTLYSRPEVWRRLQVSAMQQDFSWRRSAQQYVDLYGSITRRSDVFAEHNAIEKLKRARTKVACDNLQRSLTAGDRPLARG